MVYFEMQLRLMCRSSEADPYSRLETSPDDFLGWFYHHHWLTAVVHLEHQTMTVQHQWHRDQGCRWFIVLDLWTPNILLTWIQLTVKSEHHQEHIYRRPILDIVDLQRHLNCRNMSSRQMTSNVDGCAPVWELMGDTWNICFDHMESLFTYYC